MVALAAFLPVIGTAVDKLIGLIPDGNAKAKVEAENIKSMLDMAAKEAADQREINKVEASHSSIFVSGWRPFVGWGCAVCIFYGYLLRPWLVFAAATLCPEYADKIPEVSMDYIWELMFGMLGIGGLRTIEKCKGVAR